MDADSHVLQMTYEEMSQVKQQDRQRAAQWAVTTATADVIS